MLMYWVEGWWTKKVELILKKDKYTKHKTNSVQICIFFLNTNVIINECIVQKTIDKYIENIGSHRLFPNGMGVSLMVPDPKASEFNSRQADRWQQLKLSC